MRERWQVYMKVGAGWTPAFCLSLAAVLLSTSILQAQTQQSPVPEQANVQPSAAIEQLRARPVDDLKLAAALEAGFRLLSASRFEDAWSIFKAILDAAPQQERALYGGALALFNLRQLEASERLARAAYASIRSTSSEAGASAKSAEANRHASDALVLLGVILAVKGDGAGALKAVEEAVALSPDNFDAQFALGRARFGANDPAGAATAFRTAVRLRPTDAQARFFLATALEGAGDNEGALSAYRELLSVRPDSAEGHLGLGVLLAKLGGDRTEEGIKELQRAIAINGDLYEARITLGRALLRTNRAQEAVEHLQRAATLAPNNPEPHYQLAQAYRRLGKRAEAERENAIVREIHSSRRGQDERRN
ncbi:MAG TPA: tetratricopeptide repeat protein [Pyrinomonadaceae bacterium]